MPSNWSCAFRVQCSNVIFVRELIRLSRGIYSSCGIFHHLGVDVWRVHNTRSPYWKPFNQQTTIVYICISSFLMSICMSFYILMHLILMGIDSASSEIFIVIVQLQLFYDTASAMFKIFHEKLECMTHSFGRSMMQDMVSCMVWVIRRPRPAFFISVKYPHMWLHQFIIWAVLPMACEHPTTIIAEPINLS